MDIGEKLGNIICNILLSSLSKFKTENRPKRLCGCQVILQVFLSNYSIINVNIVWVFGFLLNFRTEAAARI